ncbi:DUF6932 family protein [Xenorhabdus bovienii]|uniref:Uncharacterized protein n=1 Tax=Xenorhabdus bovienii str. kraussei Becker Underwood TaxID=1398204 RepID=A0A077PP59_XENBV|nr:hypothetical protein [Xenorhabdus bovienii]CDH22362.1 conserved hypothetical protein [Xenorhabdus bovienii str. kraussei Becker Underwood]
MIPKFTTSGVLPPFVGESPADKAQCSPYKVKMSELVSRFATSRERVVILDGLLEFRRQYRELGFLEGFQWIDGSFVEDCESVNNRGRAPQDADLVTFVYRPLNSEKNEFISIDEMSQIVMNNMNVFVPKRAKATYQCDAYHVDLCQPPHLLVGVTTYWYGLFSHSRVDSLWKGILEINIVSDDDYAETILEEKRREFFSTDVNLGGGVSC